MKENLWENRNIWWK